MKTARSQGNIMLSNMGNLKLITLSIIVGVGAFVLGRGSALSLNNNLSQVPPTYPAPNDDASKKCIQDLQTIKNDMDTLQVGYAKLFTMGTANQDTQTYYTEISAGKTGLNDTEDLSKNLQCPSDYAQLDDTQRKLIDNYKKIYTAYFYFAKDINAQSQLILQTGVTDQTTALDERSQLEEDAAKTWLDQNNILKKQFSDGLAKIPVGN